MKTTRLLAAETVIRIIKDRAYSNIAIQNALAAHKMSETDRALCSCIVLTAAERALTLDYVIKMFVKSKPDITLQSLLYVGITQILFMDRVPFSAACDETVKAAKSMTDDKRAGFINGVLRNVCRSKDEILIKVSRANDEIRYSINHDIINLVKAQYPDRYRGILEAYFKKQPLCLRANTTRISVSELGTLFSEKGIRHEIKGNTIYVFDKQGAVISDIYKGLYFVQGFASQFAVGMLEAKEDSLVIDVCACPGGKTFGAAIDMCNKGRVISLDIHENKLSLIEKGAKTLGINIIETAVHDSRTPIEQYIGTADRVICDVPCSALGVISSKPEIRYKNVSDLTPLLDTQKKILAASAKYLKKGGTLVYSTCTVNKNENHVQVASFLENNPDYALVAERQFVPGDGDYDGFYVARIVRK